MRKRNGLIVYICIALCLICTSCANLSLDEVVVHDEIFTYNAGIDATYLTVLEAVNDLPEWTLDTTNRNEGIIVARRAGCDGDTAIIIVTPIAKKQVSVELAPASQKVPGVGEILKAIDAAMMQS